MAVPTYQWWMTQGPGKQGAPYPYNAQTEVPAASIAGAPAETLAPPVAASNPTATLASVAAPANAWTERQFTGVDTTPQGWDVSGYSGMIQNIIAKNPNITQEALDAAILQSLAESRLAGGSNDRTMYESPEMEAARRSALQTYGIGAMERAEAPKLKRATLGAMAERGIGLGGLSDTAMTEALGRARGEWQQRRGDLMSAATNSVGSARASNKQYGLDLANLNLMKESNELAKQQYNAQQAAANAKTGFASWGPAVTKSWKKNPFGTFLGQGYMSKGTQGFFGNYSQL